MTLKTKDVGDTASGAVLFIEDTAQLELELLSFGPLIMRLREVHLVAR